MLINCSYGVDEMYIILSILYFKVRDSNIIQIKADLKVWQAL